MNSLQAKKGKIRKLRIAGFLMERNLREIEKDAWGLWAQKETPEFKIIKPLTYEHWKATPLHRFVSSIMP